MIGRKFLLCGAFLALALGLMLTSPAQATDVFWDGGAGTTFWGVNPAPNDANMNWNPNFTPQASFSERAVLGTDDPAPGQLAAMAEIAASPPNVGGIAMGLREIDSFGVFVNSEPASGTLTGQLTITGGTVNSRTTSQSTFGADGRVLVGVHGRGYLTMTGGTLNATRLVVAGEDVSTGMGRSRVELSGNAALVISNAQNGPGQTTNNANENTASFGRDLVVTGPNVTMTSFGRLTLSSTNRYTANITSPTAHSVLRTTDNIAVVSGSLAVNFSGAGNVTHPIGQSWNLVDSPLAIAGNFTGLGFNSNVPVSGLTTPAPRGTEYRVRKISDGTGQTIQLVKDRHLVAVVNRNTGQITIENPQADSGALDPGAIQIDGYTIASARGSMLTSFSGISGQVSPPDTGWFKPVDGSSQPLNTVNVLTEIKQPIFTPPSNPTFGVGPTSSFSIGSGFSKTGVAANVSNFGNHGEDLVFSYSTPDGVFRGTVEYVGTRFENNMVLRVNQSGQAFLKNDSLETLTFDGYTITSSTGSLTGGAPWTGLSAAAGWQKSPATASALSQTNPTASSTLAPGAELSLGDIGSFTTAAAQDGLQLKFILSVGLEGTGGGTIAGDFDEDGDVDGRDFLAWQRNTSVGNLTDWQANYGMSGGGGTNPPETTFRIGSVVFDDPLSLGAFTAVPEPSSALLLFCAIAGVLGIGRGGKRASKQLCNLTTSRRDHERGTHIMSRQIGWSALALMAIALFAGNAQAVTQAIPLVNGDFELPGPTGTKVVAFTETGVPIAPSPVTPPAPLSSGVLSGSIPGWTFTGGDGGAGEACPGSGLGCEISTQYTDGLPGDSGTEGKGAGLPGNDLLLSTVDGKVYQTSSVSMPVAVLPATQKLLLTFEAGEIFTPTGEAQLTAWLYYVDGGGARQTIGSPLVVGSAEAPLEGRESRTLEFIGGSSALTPALGRPIGVSFDTTSREFDATVVESWVGIDNVLIEIAGTLAGDFNGDGDINLNDYFIIRDNLEEPHSYLFEGDIVRDGFVDLNDFRAWKSLPSVINSGVLARIAAIPEPSSVTLIMITAATMGAFSRRRFRNPPPRPKLRSAGGEGLGEGSLESDRFLGVSQMINAKLLAVITAVGLLSIASSATAAVLHYDPFLTGANPAAGQYAIGALVPTVGNGQNPTIGPPSFFTGAWEVFNADVLGTQVQAPGLSFLGSPAAGGSLVVAQNPDGTTVSSRAGRRLTTPFTATTVGTYYMSFLANFGGVGVNPASTTRDDVAHRAVEMWTDTGTIGDDGSLAFRVGYMSYNGNFNSLPPSEAPLKAGPTGGTEVIIEGGPASFLADNGSTHLIVLKFTLSDQPTSDTIELFLNPTENDEPIIANASWFNRDFTLGAVSGPIQFGGVGTPMQFDELRVADTYIDVLPDFPLKGDTNGDDLVNMLDYQAIVTHMNLTGQTTANGDVTGDGRVDLRDLRLWRDNRTDGALTGVDDIGVPEPTTLLLAAGALVGWSCLGRGRKL